MSFILNKLNKLIPLNNGFVTSKIRVSPQQARFKYYQVTYDGAKNHWPQWSMMKDQRKRMTFREYGPHRIRYNAIRKAEILPKELREVTDHEINTLPYATARMCLQPRCCVTSRGRGVVLRWRLSRFIFRHLADYNKLAGVQRGFWK